MAKVHAESGTKLYPKQLPSINPPQFHREDSLDSNGNADTSSRSGRKRISAFRVSEGVESIKAPRITYKGHQSAILSVTTLSLPEALDTLVLSGGEDKQVLIWSLKHGTRIATLKGHTQRVVTLDSYYSASTGPMAVTGSWDESIRVWSLPSSTSESDASPRKHLFELTGYHTNRITAVKIVEMSSESPVIVSASTDATIRVWSMSKGEHMYVIMNPAIITWVLCLDVFICPENGPLLFSGGKDRVIRVWKLAPPDQSGNSVPVKEIQNNPSRIKHIAVHHSKSNSTTYILTICRDFVIRIWSYKSGDLVRSLKGHQETITDIALCSSDDENAIVVSSCANGNIRVWSLETGELLRVFKGHTEEALAVTCLESPENKGDIILVSGSKDTTLRTWLFAEEMSLLELKPALKITDESRTKEGLSSTAQNSVVEESRNRVNDMAVYCDAECVAVVTVSEDGTLRMYEISQKLRGSEEVWSKKVSSQRLRAVAIYTSDIFQPPISEDGTDVIDISQDIVICAGRDNIIRMYELWEGNKIGPDITGHDGPITNIFSFNGVSEQVIDGVKIRAVDPFFLTGSEDNTMRMWCLKTGKCQHVLDSHTFDVTAVCAYIHIPKPRTKKLGGSVPSSSRSGKKHQLPLNCNISTEPILLSAGVDTNILLWSCDGNILADLDDSDAPLTSLATLNLPNGPIVAAGDINGVIRIWSLEEPYTLKHTLYGHTDEIQSIAMRDIEGQYPVLVSSSWDMTIRVYSLKTFKHIKTIEGHTAEVTSVAIFCPCDGDPAVASSSADSTVRISFDFLGTLPNKDFVRQAFEFDSEQKNSHVMAEALREYDSSWPRVSQLVNEVGAEAFFVHYSYLFKLAIERVKIEFVLEFLPQTRIGLVKSNSSKPCKEVGVEASLLAMAIAANESHAVSAIVSCWIHFLTSTPSGDDDLLYDENGELQREDLLLLSREYPAEFSRLICSIKLQPTSRRKSIKDGDFFLYEKDSKEIGLKMYSSKVVDKNTNNSHCKHRDVVYKYLPLPHLAHTSMLQAMSDVCDELDNVAIFDSDVGQMALSYAWRKFGRTVHIYEMAVYYIYVVIGAISVYTFSDLKDTSYWPVSLCLIALQLLLTVYIAKSELNEFNTLTDLSGGYFSEVWNQIEMTIIISGLCGNIVRLVYWDDNQISRVLLSINSICMWFQTLYYLRAFEATGPLVSMILRIAHDMQALMFVVFVVLLGFSQAFWLISTVDDDLAFASIDGSLINSFSFMLGGFDPEAFDGLSYSMKSYGLFLSAVYMLIVSILLLNLLIALMGDSYGSVKEKGLAQWRLEQTSLIIENLGEMTDEEKFCEDRIFYRMYDDEVNDAFVQDSSLEAKLLRLEESNEKIEGLLKDILEKIG